MLLAQALVTAVYLVFVVRVWTVSRQLRAQAAATGAAVALVVEEERLTPYVEDGLAALDAYLSEGYAP